MEQRASLALVLALFAALGSLYDPEATAPDGHFLIPDYRGYFLRGTDGSS